MNYRRLTYKTEFTVRAAARYVSLLLVTISLVSSFGCSSDLEQPVTRLQGHRAAVTALDFSDSGKLLLSGSLDRSVKVWDLENGQLIRSFDKHKDQLVALFFLPPQRVISTSIDGESIVWEWESGKVIQSLQHKSRVSSVVIAQKRKRLLVNASGKLTIWNMDTLKPLQELEYPAETKSPLFVSQDNNVYFILSEKSSESEKIPHASQVSNQGGNKTAKLHPDTTEIGIWGVTENKLLSRFPLSYSGMRNLLVSPDNQLLLLSGLYIHLWDINKRKRLTQNPISKEQPAWGVQFSPDGNQLLVSEHGGVIFWDLTQKVNSKKLLLHDSVVTTMVFSPGGNNLATGSQDRTIKLWSWEKLAATQ